MSTIELTSKVRELKELQAMASEIKAEIESLQDEIKAEMAARDTEEMQIDVFKVRYTSVKSSRFDTTAFKATHAELYSQYVKQTLTRRFSIV